MQTAVAFFLRIGESKPETTTQQIRVDANISSFGLPGLVWTTPLFGIENTKLTRKMYSCFLVC